MAPFPSCRRAYGHFGGACANCKWPDYASSCSLRGAPDNADMYDDNWPYEGNQLQAPGQPALGTAARPLLLDAPPGDDPDNPMVID